MLQKARVTAFTVSELSRENQQGGRVGVKLPPPTPPTPPASASHNQIRVKPVTVFAKKKQLRCLRKNTSEPVIRFYDSHLFSNSIKNQFGRVIFQLNTKWEV